MRRLSNPFLIAVLVSALFPNPSSAADITTDPTIENSLTQEVSRPTKLIGFQKLQWGTKEKDVERYFKSKYQYSQAVQDLRLYKGTIGGYRSCDIVPILKDGALRRVGIAFYSQSGQDSATVFNNVGAMVCDVYGPADLIYVNNNGATNTFKALVTDPAPNLDDLLKALRDPDGYGVCIWKFSDGSRIEEGVIKKDDGDQHQKAVLVLYTSPGFEDEVHSDRLKDF